MRTTSVCRAVCSQQFGAARSSTRLPNGSPADCYKLERLQFLSRLIRVSPLGLPVLKLVSSLLILGNSPEERHQLKGRSFYGSARIHQSVGSEVGIDKKDIVCIKRQTRLERSHSGSKLCAMKNLGKLRHGAKVSQAATYARLGSWVWDFHPDPEACEDLLLSVTSGRLLATLAFG
jgi:hypothetical protein